LFILSLILLLIAGFDDLILGVTISLLALTFFICLLVFYKLTITIDTTHLSFSFGIGLFSKKYFITDIKSCKPVKNNPFYGIGIRLIPDGWLYNVSGLQAIELTFRNRKSKIRIGTNRPEEIASLINKMIENEIPESISPEPKRSNYILTLVIILLVVILPTGIILYGKQEIKTEMTKSKLNIKGMFGLTIKYSDINQLDTVNSLPRIKRRTKGFILGRTLKGNYTLEDSTAVILFITMENPPYIHIKTEDLNLYLNFKDPGKTVNLYNTLMIRLSNDEK
jgi:hypothetical protein